MCAKRNKDRVRPEGDYEELPDVMGKELLGAGDLPEGHQPKQAGRVYNLISIFAVRRDLQPVTKLLVARTGLTLPEADILLMLYGLRELSWKDCHINGDGFVRFKDLKSVVLNDPSLFTRRVNTLSSSAQQLIEVRRAQEIDSKLRGNSRYLRITEKGLGVAKVIWERYIKLAEAALQNFTPSDLDAHRRVNEGLSRVLREWVDPDKWLLRILE